MKSQFTIPTNPCQSRKTAMHNELVLQRGLLLIEGGHYEAADTLLSAELLFQPNDPELWLIAGLARFQKGNLRTAESAFKMSAWLNDNPCAREMLKLIGE